MNYFISSVGGFKAAQNKQQQKTIITPEASLQHLPNSSIKFFSNILNNSNLRIEVIVLQKTYMPTILAHDAMYLVVTGKGVFCKGSSSQKFAQGDMLIADKGTQHFFDSYENDTIVWQIFYAKNKLVTSTIPQAQHW